MHRFLATALLSLAPAAAQTVVVDCPDSVLNAPQGQYPIYLATTLNVVRGQSLCPGTFAGLPTTPMLCTRVGVQLAETGAGPVTYAQFVVRAGATSVSALTGAWATNLPDQRVQADLSNQPIAGGPLANIWVEFPLANPFPWQPGQGIVVDFTTQALVAGSWLRTALSASVPRCISTNYTGGNGSAQTGGGLKLRMVFEPLGGVVQWAPGCPGSGGFVPSIGTIGQSTIGNAGFAVTLTNALGNALAAAILGFPATFDLGGGCVVHNDGSLFLLTGTSGAGPGAGTAALAIPIPNDPNLFGFVVDAQWGVLDTASPSPLGAAVSFAGKVVLY